MDSVNNLDAASRPLISNKACAADLLSVFNHYSNKISTLSLDCFDTLLWRKTATPTDVFYDLQHSQHFQAHEITAKLREQAEGKARQQMFLRRGTSEVTLDDIYKAHCPSFNENQLRDLANDELEAEIETCYAFSPVVELIRIAHSRGLRIIIVSDTYLTQIQLRHLLEKKLPQDILAMINQIFCSSEFGQSKSAGLFRHIFSKLSIAPQSILHIGDNPIADYSSPQLLGVQAVQLVHYHDDIAQLTRMQAVAGSFIDPSIRHTRSLINPFRAIFAADSQLQTAPDKAIGYAAIGPILYAFGRYICNTIDTLRQQGKQLKVLFLMRDAYLPSLVCEALCGQTIGKRVNISRFTAFASSFRNENDIDAYLESRVKSLRFKDMCNQLLLPLSVTNKILQKLKNSKDPIATFSQFIYQEKILKMIFAASTQYRSRLIKHLQQEVGLTPGDSLLFVDLGYTGTAQNQLQPVFKDEMNIDIIGCYLLALRTPKWKSSRSGLIDTSFYEDKTLSMLVNYIALLEEVCTSPESNSVIDYDKDGNPIYSTTSTHQQQNQKLNCVQSECLRFIHDANDFLLSHATQLNDGMLRDIAAINLCRLIYLPTQSELDFFQDFQFDFNFGTNEIIPVFDLHKGLASLKRRSWLHSARENLKNMRTNYPAEWRATSLELALTLMAQHRFGLEVTLNDLSHRREQLAVLALQGDEVSPFILQAMPTHDGYFSIMIPVVSEKCQLVIQLGLKYQWIELESADLIPMSHLYTIQEFEHTEDASAYLTADQMNDKGGGLFECLTESSLLVFTPPATLKTNRLILRMIFRPIVRR